MQPSSTQTTQSFFERYAFWFLLLAAALLRQVPVISLPFNWLESYFHELSHGLAAVITGGSIVKIELFPNGAGLCTTLGGSRFFTAFMGYTGAALWGAMICSLSAIHQRLTQVFTTLLLALLAISCLLWGRDLLTFIIIGSLIALFALKFKFLQSKWYNVGVQLVGLTVLLNALMSPFYLIDGRNKGDGATLANLTFIPELVWVFIWAAFALFLLYLLAKKQGK